VNELKIIVVYDSAYGNTEKIARAIAGSLGAAGEVGVWRAGEMKEPDLKGVGLVVAGSPTQGFRPLPTVQKWLDGIPEDDLKGVKAAAFDTRIGGKEAGGAGKFIARLGGYAATRIASTLKKKGADLVAEPEGFMVNDSKGPLGKGELERAAEWGKKIAEAAMR
jgi:flavodoxin I